MELFWFEQKHEKLFQFANHKFGTFSVKKGMHDREFSPGQLEILASAFDYSTADGGHLWLYQQPESGDFRDEAWTRTAVASGFTANNFNLGNKMTPGKHRTFYPSE
ncbi:MAG: hypothetical protein AAF479_14060 [Pseudomonadota bacterium]